MFDIIPNPPIQLRYADQLFLSRQYVHSELNRECEFSLAHRFDSISYVAQINGLDELVIRPKLLLLYDSKIERKFRKNESEKLGRCEKTRRRMLCNHLLPRHSRLPSS